jgi:hypothetical protein
MKKNEIGGKFALMEQMRKGCNILVSKSEGMRSRRRSEDNITMDLRERDSDGVERMHLAKNGDQWLAVVNTVMNLQVTGWMTVTVFHQIRRSHKPSISMGSTLAGICRALTLESIWTEPQLHPQITRNVYLDSF